MGHNVVDFKPGDRVVVLPIIYDGSCDACARGYINCCENLGAFGFTGESGKSARVIRSKRVNLIQAGAGVSLTASLCHNLMSTDFQHTFP